MAFVRVQSTSVVGGNVTSVQKAFTSNVTAGNCLVVCGAAFSTTTALSVSDGANTYTPDSNQNNTWQSTVWSAPGAAAGATTVTVSTSPTSTLFLVCLHEYSGLAASLPADKALAAKQGTATGAYDSGLAAATGSAGDMLLGFMVAWNHSGIVFTAGNDGQGDSYALAQNANDATNGECAQTEEFLAGTTLTATQYKATMTLGTTSVGDSHVVSYKAAAASASNPPIAAFARQAGHRVGPSRAPTRLGKRVGRRRDRRRARCSVHT